MESNRTEPPAKLDLNKKCTISNVNFEGVHRTRLGLLSKIVADVFQSNTILDFLQRSVQVKENLETLRAFKNVDLEFYQVGEDDYEVTFVVQEKGRLTTSAQTAVDSHSTAHLNIDLALPNLNGIGDSIHLASKFTKRLYSAEARYSVPLMPWRSLWAPTYSLSYSQYQLDNLPSGFNQEDKCVNNQVNFSSLPNLYHSIHFENVWRHIKSCSPKTPIEIREQCGHSVKSSLKHTVTWDNRMGGHFPFEGILAKLSNEFTTNLVSGAAKFTRHEVNLQLNTSILPKYEVLCQFNVLAGLLLGASRINICDRFFAGGPLTLRGFKSQGLAPNVKGYPLGETAFLEAGAHIYSILPYTTPESAINEYVRPHIFVNTGTQGHDLWRLTNKDDIRRELYRFRDSLRYSCGFGLVMCFMNLRLEVNYCLPIVFDRNDLSIRGLQYGFGLTYT